MDGCNSLEWVICGIFWELFPKMTGLFRKTVKHFLFSYFQESKDNRLYLRLPLRLLGDNSKVSFIHPFLIKIAVIFLTLINPLIEFSYIFFPN